MHVLYEYSFVHDSKSHLCNCQERFNVQYSEHNGKYSSVRPLYCELLSQWGFPGFIITIKVWCLLCISTAVRDNSLSLYIYICVVQSISIRLNGRLVTNFSNMEIGPLEHLAALTTRPFLLPCLGFLIVFEICFSIVGSALCMFPMCTCSSRVLMSTLFVL